jgi:segregation and condensation protein B
VKLEVNAASKRHQEEGDHLAEKEEGKPLTREKGRKNPVAPPVEPVDLAVLAKKDAPQAGAPKTPPTSSAPPPPSKETVRERLAAALRGELTKSMSLKKAEEAPPVLPAAPAPAPVTKPAAVSPPQAKPAPVAKPPTTPAVGKPARVPAPMDIVAPVAASVDKGAPVPAHGDKRTPVPGPLYMPAPILAPESKPTPTKAPLPAATAAQEAPKPRKVVAPVADRTVVSTPPTPAPPPAAQATAATATVAAPHGPKPGSVVPSKSRAMPESPKPKMEEAKAEPLNASGPPSDAPKPKRPMQARFTGMKPMHVVEAALFSAGKPVSIEEIAETTGLPPDSVKQGIKELQKAYETKDTMLEVGKAGAKWGMQVKSQAAEPAAKFAPMEIAPKLLKTLALVAYHQPMKQSELVDMLGTKVYEHIPELVERGLVRAREEGVTKILTTTPSFPEYFGLDAEGPEEIRKVMGKLVGIDAPPKKKEERAEAPPSGDEAAGTSAQEAAAPPTGTSPQGAPGTGQAPG